MHTPELVHVNFWERGIDEVGEVRDGGLPRFFECMEDVGPAVRGVDPVDELDGEVMLIWLPGKYGVAIFLHCIDDCLDTSNNGRVRMDLVKSVSG